MNKTGTLPKIGDIQIRAYNDQPWETFVLGIALAISIVKRKFPQAQVWNGSEWVRIPIGNHIIALLKFINEDLEEKENEEKQ